MQLTSTLDGEAVKALVAQVSADKYEGNLDCGEWAGIRDTPSTRKTRRDGRKVVQFTLTCKSSRGEGARRTGQGRRSIHATWQAHYDVMAAIFEHDPAAVLRTAVATYKGRDEFNEKARATYYHNVGSIAAPAYLGAQ